ncbi:hypothetical protein MKW94_029367 [Papaver nudicaule]|uniref:F-box associated beta-propeller type 1 domain-containing protein n=1 Tax=Papaver nudicaule TaxID=74823 RepID=A0AA41V2R1_PAPNU|nr:hypothetical protein [Papaver nudicaule]
MSYAFGYDSKIDNYKMIRTVNFGDEDDSCEVRVYALRKDSWKSVGFIPYHLSYGRAPGVLGNEAIKWIANPVESDRKVILAFHISSEMFHELPQTKCLNKEFCVSVFGFKGLLFLLGNNYMVHMDIWAMKEYGVSDSWNKLFRISQPTDIRSFEYVRPIKLLYNGEVLPEKDNKTIVIYDLKHLRVRTPNRSGGAASDVGDVITVNKYPSLSIEPEFEYQSCSPVLGNEFDCGINQESWFNLLGLTNSTTIDNDVDFALLPFPDDFEPLSCYAGSLIY